MSLTIHLILFCNYFCDVSWVLVSWENKGSKFRTEANKLDFNTFRSFKPPRAGTVSVLMGIMIATIWIKLIHRITEYHGNGLDNKWQRLLWTWKLFYHYFRFISSTISANNKTHLFLWPGLIILLDHIVKCFVLYFALF